MQKKYLFYISQNYSFAILRPLQKEIRARGGRVTWFLEPNVNADYLADDEAQLTSVEAVIAFNPFAVFVPGNVVPRFIPGIKVTVFHGFDAGKLDWKGENTHFRVRGCFDLHCSYGKDMTRQFRELAKKNNTFKVVDTGWPALDPLFTESTNANPYIVPEDKRPVVQFCSTFSPRFSCAPHIIDTIKKLSESGTWRWQVQFHPKMDPDIVSKYKKLASKNLTFIETDNIIPMLQSADVMLCDTSSALLMFLLQRKPVVTFKGNQQGEHLLNVTEPEDIEVALTKALQQPPELMQEIDNYIEYIHAYTDGQSSARVLDAVDNFTFDSLKAKPQNLLRQFKLRKKLKYWKL
ncbi:MAG: CDP-glycerol glycerophosphotransferase (TagB/SpsB family) [Moritella sp.]|jgi:CDP-glycerol glycerophosphotransferase (TagB/SpsB family)